MKTCALFLLLIQSSVLCAKDAVTQPLDAPKLIAAVDVLLAEAAENGFSGAVTIAHQNRIIYDQVIGFSDRKNEEPIHSETLFHVASITKYLTALLILVSEDKKLVAMDDDISQYLKIDALKNRNITIRDLLMHESGITSNYTTERSYSSQKALARMNKKLKFSEQKPFKYTNDNYELLALMLEHIHQDNYENIARNLILKPLNLIKTNFWGSVDMNDSRILSQPLEKVSARLLKKNYGMLGSSGLLTNSHDLVKLQLAVLNGELKCGQSSCWDQIISNTQTESFADIAYGSFFYTRPKLHRYFSARGYESWGDNAILNHYPAFDLVLSVVTSKGPLESSGEAPFRSQISGKIETAIHQNHSSNH